MRYDMDAVTGVLLMKTINYKWIGGNNLRKRTDGERTKRNGYCNLLLTSSYSCSLFRMCSGYSRFRSFSTKLFGYLFVFQFILFLYSFLKNIHLEKRQPVFDNKSHFVINLIANTLPIVVAFFLSFAIIRQTSLEGEPWDEINAMMAFAYGIFLFVPYVFIIYYFVMAPIRKERKRFQKKYHENRKGK